MISEPIRAAVISDTHGLLRPEVERILQTCDVVIHAGDFDNQMLFHKLNISWPLYAVRGNNDDYWAEQLPTVRRFLLGNVHFLMAHDRSDLPEDLGDAQVVIFGHSHMPSCCKKEGRLWLNPGSCGYRRFTLPLSLNVLILSEEGCEIETFWLKENEGKFELQKESTWFTKYQETLPETEEKGDIPKGAGKAGDWFGPLERAEEIKVGKSAAERKAEEANTRKSTAGGKAEEANIKNSIDEGKEQDTNAGQEGRRKARESAGRAGVRQKLGEAISRKRKEYVDCAQNKEHAQDQLFLVAKIMRLMKRGQPVEWVAGNLQVEPGFVETIYRICVTHPGVNAHQILDKMEVNQIFEHR